MNEVDRMNRALVGVVEHGGGVPIWISIVFKAKDGWSGREETPYPKPKRDEDEDGSIEDEDHDEVKVEQIMYAVCGLEGTMTLSGWLFQELVRKPTKKSAAKGKLGSSPADLLNVSTWEWCTDAVVWREEMYVGADCASLKEMQLQDVPVKMQEFVAMPPPWRRLRGDRMVRYGDGGESELCFPLLFAPDLGLSPQRRGRLCEALLILARKSKDYQPKQKHVQDIIDPDLCPMLLPNWKQAREAELTKLLNQPTRPPNYYDLRNEKRDLSHLPSYLEMRKSYRWIPSCFVVSKDRSTAEWKVNIRSPINGLPISEDTKEIYQNIAQIFKKMVPMWAELGGLGLELLDGNKKNKTTEVELRVVVKCQQYEMPPRSSYSGKWHIEGCDERVTHVGVYYVQVEEGLTGGALKFRIPEGPSESYGGNPDLAEVQCLPGTGSAVAFSNTLPHRFRKIVNDSDEMKRRLFVNFFILDPENQVPIQLIPAGRSEVIAVLRRACPALPRDILRIILSFFPYLWPSLRAAKEFRDKVKVGMGQAQSGWGWIHYGNCGVIKYINDRKWDSSTSGWSSSEFRHSDSGGSDTTTGN